MTLKCYQITKECNVGFKDTTIGIQKSLQHIAETAEKVPGEMSKEFSGKINELIQTILNNLKRRPEIYFKQIADHKAAVQSLQLTN